PPRPLPSVGCRRCISRCPVAACRCAHSLVKDRGSTGLCSLSLPDALPIYIARRATVAPVVSVDRLEGLGRFDHRGEPEHSLTIRDRKSTRLNSSHVATSYAVFRLKKKHELLLCEPGAALQRVLEVLARLVG